MQYTEFINEDGKKEPVYIIKPFIFKHIIDHPTCYTIFYPDNKIEVVLKNNKKGERKNNGKNRNFKSK